MPKKINDRQISAVQRLCPAVCTDGGMVLVFTLWILVILSFLLLTLFQSVHLLMLQAQMYKNEIADTGIGPGAVYAVAAELSRQRKILKNKSDNPNKSNSDDSNNHNAAGNSADGRSSESKSSSQAPDARFKRGEELGYYVVIPDGWKVTRYDKNTWDSEQEQNWGEKTFVLCRVRAEDAKAPANIFKKENWQRLPNVNQDTAEKILKYIKENGKRLSCIEQLLAVENLSSDIFLGKNPGESFPAVLTVFSQGKLYINRASALAISASLNIDRDKAQDIANAVEAGHFFMDATELEKAVGPDFSAVSQNVSLICCSYRIEAFSIINGHVYRYDAVIVFSDDGKYKVAYMGKA